jgi:hypothetical protein
MTNSVEVLPERSEVEQRAYELFLSRGARHGNDFGDWISAETELKQSAKQRKARVAAAWQMENFTVKELQTPEIEQLLREMYESGRARAMQTGASAGFSDAAAD